MDFGQERYAGWLGTVAARYTVNGKFADDRGVPSLEESKHRLAVVAGTSTCHLVQVGYPFCLVCGFILLNA
jgi:ribulose kinase